MRWRLRPLRKFLHMQREGNSGTLICRSSQVPPPLIIREHFNYTRICSHCNMVVPTWHRVNTCESWLYSEATVAAMPQGVAVWLVNTKFKKQPQISSHQARSLLLGRLILEQTENIFLPSHPHGKGPVFKRRLTKPAIITAVTDSDPCAWNLAGAIQNPFYKSCEITDNVTFRARGALQICSPKWRLIGVRSPQNFKHRGCRSNRVQQRLTLFNRALCVKQREVSLHVLEHLWEQVCGPRASHYEITITQWTPDWLMAIWSKMLHYASCY